MNSVIIGKKDVRRVRVKNNTDEVLVISADIGNYMDEIKSFNAKVSGKKVMSITCDSEDEFKRMVIYLAIVSRLSLKSKVKRLAALELVKVMDLVDLDYWYNKIINSYTKRHRISDTFRTISALKRLLKLD
ncbi:hypothetical protein [Saccharolobus shibatae]|uniref:Uncharacterized protein n=1 Tax=Saccharolobus shibatae TaxID=2286 RepID=A0A8F5BVP4_9CREN|nr:hypothetical protein [Saccharolobus shibatae]QXJ32183.1 hypothetical protein J5U21_01834 [Saccharolobus shibatae]QXJ35195.1 hypothetical protein J5U22_01742 [Saccharolobus shibatae]